MIRKRRKRLLPTAITITAAAALGASPAVLADFVLNWSAANVSPTFPGNLDADQIIHGLSTPIGDQTPFLYERVNVGGEAFYHLVIGDGVGEDGRPTVENFGQEVYIQLTNAINHGSSFGQIGSAGSASGGASPLGSNPTTATANHRDPLSNSISISGNATGNPERVVMRQIVNDTGLSQEFTKDALLEKPSIVNQVTSGGLTTLLSIDATGLTYDDPDTAAQVTNTLSIVDADIPQNAANFNLAQDGQTSGITAGRFIYTEGNTPLGHSGVYTYTDGGSASLNPGWNHFFDHGEDNPWAYNENRPVE